MQRNPEPQTLPSGLNRQVFYPNDRVFIVPGTPGVRLVGSVIGIATRNVIDTYIVLLDEPIRDCGWRAIAIHSTALQIERYECHGCGEKAEFFQKVDTEISPDGVLPICAKCEVPGMVCSPINPGK